MAGSRLHQLNLLLSTFSLIIVGHYQPLTFGLQQATDIDTFDLLMPNVVPKKVKYLINLSTRSRVNIARFVSVIQALAKSTISVRKKLQIDIR